MANKKKGGLNPRQKAFADLWIKSYNGTQSAIQAGYSKRSAGSIASELLKKPEIRDYIHERVHAQDLLLVADADEALVFLSSVMRGEVKDAFGLDASLADRVKACESLLKRYEAMDKAEKKEDNTVRIVLENAGTEDE